MLIYTFAPLKNGACYPKFPFEYLALLPRIDNVPSIQMPDNQMITFLNNQIMKKTTYTALIIVI